MATWEEWSAALARTGAGITPAELHGSVTGYLCAGWSGRPAELLEALAFESDHVAADLHRQLDAMARAIAGALRTGDGVAPLLPAGPLPARADAAVDWCRGFLGGLGLTGVLDARKWPPAIHGVLDGFAQVAASHLHCDEDDDAALDTVLDFIRDGVAQLHAALAPGVRA